MYSKKKNFYENYYPNIIQAQEMTIKKLFAIKEEDDVIEHIYTRIKSAESTKQKLSKLNFEVSAISSITKITDVVGIRVICKFIDDIDVIIDKITKNSFFKVLARRDYINSPKPNGYRSYHIIVEVSTDDQIKVPVEIQIRTISQDAWASLEHKMKYKHEIKEKKVIEQELKRCADELAATDMSMQTIKDLIEGKLG